MREKLDERIRNPLYWLAVMNELEPRIRYLEDALDAAVSRITSLESQIENLRGARLSGKRRGIALIAVCSAMPLGEWEVSYLIERISADVPRKGIYNAIGYLARRGVISNISYGRYRTL